MGDILPLRLSRGEIEQNFREIAPPLTAAEALLEADRCLYCYNAPCTRACPTHIDVPAFIKKIASGNLTGAARVIFDANPIGATCARVCPVSVLCEGACVENTRLHRPIPIGRLQRCATDALLQSGRSCLAPGPSNGRKVAVIGAGPAGLSCAVYLARLGYRTTVFERRPLPGGLDTYGMAEYKMTMPESLAEVALVEKLGVEMRLNTEIGKDIAFADLEAEYDALFVGVGLGGARRLEVPGEDLPGVCDALEFIARVKTRRWEDVAVGRIVAVIGAGNTAIDAATQAKRLGAEGVLVVYRRSEREIPAYAYEYALAKQDGIEFVWQAAPAEIVARTDGSGVAALRCVRTTPGPPDASGRLSALPVADSHFDIPCDMVLKAPGQETLSGVLAGIPGLIADGAGRIQIDSETMQTGNPKVFAGGDCVNGGREAVDAAQAGKQAAMGIHRVLTGERVVFAGADSSA